MSELEDVVGTVDVETVAVTTPVPPIANSQQPQADLGKVRELVLKAHPDVVPDLVRGSSVDELIASVEPARGAYQRIADQVRTESGVGSRTAEVGSRTTVGAGEDGGSPPLATSEVNSSSSRLPTSDSIVVQPPTVPAGGATNVADPGDLGPTTKIAQALAARKGRG